MENRTDNSLRRALLGILEVSAASIVHCRLSSCADAPQLTQLLADLVEHHATFQLYSSLADSSASLASPSSSQVADHAPDFATSLDTLFDLLREVEESLAKLASIFVEIPTIRSPHAQAFTIELSGQVLSQLENERQSLSRRVSVVDLAFRGLWRLRLEIPGTRVIPSASEGHYSVDPFIADFRRAPFSAQLSGLPEMTPQFWSEASIDALMALASAEADGWVDHLLKTRSYFGICGLLCEHLWCGPVGTADRLIARVRTQLHGLEPAAMPIERVLREWIIRSRLPDHVVTPVGAPSTGKDTLINALVGASVLPSGCRSCQILHAGHR